MTLRLIAFLLPQNSDYPADELLKELNIVASWHQNTLEDILTVHVLAEASQVENIIQTME